MSSAMYVQDQEDLEEIMKDMSVLKVLRRLFQYIGLGNKRLMIPLSIIMLLNVLFSWFTPLIFRAFIDEGLGGGQSSEGNIDTVVYLGFLFFFMTIAGVITRIAQGYIVQKIAIITMYNLRERMFTKFLELGLDYHHRKDKTAGKKINYLTGDIETINELIQSGMLVAVSNFFLIFGAVFFMLILSPLLTLIVFSIIPVFLLIGGTLFRKARRYFNELREKVSNVTSILDESIMGMRIIQAFSVEDENYQRFNEATEWERKATMKAAKLMAFIPGTMILVITSGFAALFLTAGILIRQGLSTEGTLVAFMFYIFMFYEPLFSLIAFVTLLQNSLAAGARIIRLLDEEIAIKDKPDAIELNHVKGKIEYQNVNFSYEKGVPVLKNINVSIAPKERLALVGYTGAGKSTFIKLLTRFYDVEPGGRILIDGHDIRDIKKKSLRKLMGIVLQENFLFSGTVMENIKYGMLDASDEDVYEVAKKIKIHDMIMSLENGYNTVVGERGTRLSEGQRQLISFARALIANPPILILDEATSSIDPFSELLIQQALETLLKGRTSITIAHRLSTVINSDRILVLDKGQIIEQGSHEELVKKEDGFYKHLYEMQFKDPYKTENMDDNEEIELVDVTRESYDKDRRPRFF
ncbi:MAG: ABC transporter ATP-binding protein [Promethearchaeota archaeon]